MGRRSKRVPLWRGGVRPPSRPSMVSSAAHTPAAPSRSASRAAYPNSPVNFPAPPAGSPFRPPHLPAPHTPAAHVCSTETRLGGRTPLSRTSAASPTVALRFQRNLLRGRRVENLRDLSPPWRRLKLASCRKLLRGLRKTSEISALPSLAQAPPNPEFSCGSELSRAEAQQKLEASECCGLALPGSRGTEAWPIVFPQCRPSRAAGGTRPNLMA